MSATPKAEGTLWTRFLKEATQSDADVSVFMDTAVRLTGYVSDFDADHLVLVRGDQKTLIRMRSVLSVVIALEDDEDEL